MLIVTAGLPTAGKSSVAEGLGRALSAAAEAARRQWRTLADRHRAPVAFTEVVCSDSRVHRQRLERRSRGIVGWEEPTWEAVQERRATYEPWTDHRLVLNRPKARLRT
ncbi:hypothetical protein ABT084_37790 [Streptomyces sp. NPDC002138]|uniref:hypothetical protein n=1 Tax=Streptomyces sp. NPDC002138 TaxID=3154410 RepID=UPI00331F8545